MVAIQAKPWWAVTPDLVDHPDVWIQDQIIRKILHPQWWKELRALYRDLGGGLNNAQALHFAQWQVTAFQLPLAQEEVSGWWGTPPSLSKLGPWDFLPHTVAPRARDFWVAKQEVTLALIWALQHCA